MKYKITISSLEYYCFHGVYPIERKKGGKYIVDIDVYIKSKPINDKITEVVDYTKIISLVSKEMKKPKKLVETLVFIISKKIKKSDKRIKKCSVKIKKLNPRIKNTKLSSFDVETII